MTKHLICGFAAGHNASSEIKCLVKKEKDRDSSETYDHPSGDVRNNDWLKLYKLSLCTDNVSDKNVRHCNENLQAIDWHYWRWTHTSTYVTRTKHIAFWFASASVRVPPENNTTARVRDSNESISFRIRLSVFRNSVCKAVKPKKDSKYVHL